MMSFSWEWGRAGPIPEPGILVSIAEVSGPFRGGSPVNRYKRKRLGNSHRAVAATMAQPVEYQTMT